MRGPSILQVVHLDETGDSLHRMKWPADQLAAQRPDWRVINLDYRHPERYRWAVEADLLVLFQSADLDFLPVLKKRRELGKKTVVEYNDNFYAAQAWSPVGPVWNSPLLWQTYELLIEAADALMVTGPGLKALFQDRFPRKEIQIFPNHHPFDLKDFESLWPSPALWQVGWAGSLGHMADVLSLSAVLRPLLTDFSQFQVRLMGNRSLPEVTRLPSERLHFQHWSNMNDYYQFWEACHLGIAPLHDSEYNHCRSDAKAVEMSAMGVCPILQARTNYKDFISQTGCWSFENFSDLRELLIQMFSGQISAQEIRARAERAHDYVRRFRLGRERSERAEFYQSLLPYQFSALTNGPESPGLHQVSHRAEPVMGPSLVVLEKLKLHLASKQIREAEQLVDRYLSEHGEHPEVCLYALQVLHLSGSDQVEKWCQKFKAKFPRDLRLILFQIQRAHTFEDSQSLWEELVSQLKSLPIRVREFFYPPVAETLSRALEQSSQAIVWAESLRCLFSELTAKIDFSLAQAYEREGASEKALALFQELTKAQASVKRNHSLFQQLSPGYLEAWEESLSEQTALKMFHSS